jgi:hypothetical protein
MPTTLTGLLLFVVLLLPGMTYVAIRERHTPEQRRSPFRETATVATVSIAANAFALGIFALVRVAWQRGTPDVGEIVRDADSYLNDNYAQVALWGAGVLAFSIVSAAIAAKVIVRRDPHPSAMSSWWLLFRTWLTEMKKEEQRDDLFVRAACYLADGSVVEGTVSDFNRLTDETPDRDLILVGPIMMRDADGTRSELEHHAACVAARDKRVTHAPGVTRRGRRGGGWRGGR